MALKPLIAICGTTGVGKSKLAVELALRLAQENPSREWRSARIVNADAMQAYKGLDIVTNKMPCEERQGVDHLLMDFKEPGEQYVVGQWVNDAMDAIDETHRRKEVPIVVGGTSYWLQHLVFPNRLAVEPNSHPGVVPSPPSGELAKSLSSLRPELLELFNSLPSTPPSAADDPASAFRLHSLLAALDTPMSDRWHWRDTRKVLRSLLLIKETGKRTSFVYQEQSQTTVTPRYRALFLWLYANPLALNPRLEQRVNEMIKNGLLAEVVAMRTAASMRRVSRPLAVDCTVGVYQSIGFKEFNRYLDDPAPTEASYAAAVIDMKNSTRRYAKRQVSWIRNKLLPAINTARTTASSSDESPHVFLFDASDPDLWHACVQNFAMSISEGNLDLPLLRTSEHRTAPCAAFLACTELPSPCSLSRAAEEMLSVKDKPTDAAAVFQARRKVICQICTVDTAQPVMLEKGAEWAAHEKARSHRRLARRVA